MLTTLCFFTDFKYFHFISVPLFLPADTGRFMQVCGSAEVEGLIVERELVGRLSPGQYFQMPAISSNRSHQLR